MIERYLLGSCVRVIVHVALMKHLVLLSEYKKQLEFNACINQSLSTCVSSNNNNKKKERSNKSYRKLLW